jgi:chorismate synthase
MSIQAIKGVEIGAGFVCAHLPGSAIHDEIYMGVDGRPYRATNRAGGLEGGMTNGEPLVVRAAMKPIPTLMTPLKTVDLATGAEVLASKERSDTCAVPAASVVGEAMVSFVLADAICTQFHADSMTDLRSSIAAYHARLESVWGRA